MRNKLSILCIVIMGMLLVADVSAMGTDRSETMRIPANFSTLEEALASGFEGTIRAAGISPESVYNAVALRGATRATIIVDFDDRTVRFDSLGRIERITWKERSGRATRSGDAINNWFSDDFNDGVIDTALWTVSGDGVNELNGVVRLVRNAANDSLDTLSDYDGGFEVEVESRIAQIEWHDMFHGISIINSQNRGISFGFSVYGTFYLGQQSDLSTSFYYFNNWSLGQWYQWRFVKGIGARVDVYVNGSALCSGSVAEDLLVIFPGFYTDGGSGTESISNIDNFSISYLADNIDVYRVPQDVSTIQGALDLVGAGDTVLVAPGTYVENLTWPSCWEVKLLSEDGPRVTFIDGNQSGTVMVVDDWNEFTLGDSIFRGFTLTNGDDGGVWPYGGGLCLSGGQLQVENVVIDGNTGTEGGGVYFACHAFMTGCSITNNTAINGGGIYQYSSFGTFTNCVISSNSAADGGGIYSPDYDESDFVNCTICANTATGSGGGLYSGAWDFRTMANSIVWGNSATTDPQIFKDPLSYLNVTYSDVQGGLPGLGNIDADPLFVDEAGRDYHLTWNSPCKNVGNNNATGLPADDFEGDPRTVLTTVDMGADEYHYHLYYTGAAVPGSTIEIKTIGLSALPVTLALGSGIRIPPLQTSYGALYLDWPLAWQGVIGTCNADGILVFPATVPTNWSPGDDKPFQALIGPLGHPYTRLSNLMILNVE